MGDIKWMKQAMELAYRNAAEGNGGPFACLVVKDGTIVGRGTNQVTTLGDPTAHAEVQAIRDACRQLGHFQLDACDVYTSCEPCPMCLGALYWARPRAIYYGYSREEAAAIGFDDAFIYEELARPIAARRIPMRRIESEAATEFMDAFDLWSRMEGKVEY